LDPEAYCQRMDELVVATVARFDVTTTKYWSKNMYLLDLGNFIAIV
jgi:hypothetical protein